ncbi:MAG: hypothetical protein ACRDGJ_11240 [Candidatus Limnocylindria bacterium]
MSQAVEWLLKSDEPAIRGMTRRDLLDESDPSDLGRVLVGPLVQRLLAGQQADGGFGGHPYAKWTGAHWRLVTLVELEIPPLEPRAVAAAETVLAWLTGPRHRSAVRRVNGLIRRCASQEGNALAVCCRLGLADDPRVALLASSLVEWQWPDGGWNCDLSASGYRSSFHETLSPMWGLWEYGRHTGDSPASDAAHRAAELFLEHRIFRSLRTGEPIHPTFLQLHYPPYWHYDALQALHVLTRLGRAGDERASDAIELLKRRRLPDGRWRAGAYWWHPPGASRASEVIDWGRSRPSAMITLNALRILRAARAVEWQAPNLHTMLA